MRCPNCNTFVPYDTEVEPEEQGTPEVDERDVVTLEYRRVLTCENCGEELKEYTFEMEHPLQDLPDACPCEGEARNWEVTIDGAEPTMDVITKDRHGRPIKRARYMKTTYGVEVSGTVTCQTCQAEESFTVADAAQASAFEELV